MRISDCIRINNGQNLKIIVTMLSCYNGKVVSLKKWGRFRIIHQQQVLCRLPYVPTLAEALRQLLSDAIMLNHVAYITAVLCPIGKARHALQRIRQFPDDWQLLRLWHQWLCEVAACIFYVIHEGTLCSPILSHSSCR